MQSIAWPNLPVVRGPWVKPRNSEQSITVGGYWGYCLLPAHHPSNAWRFLVPVSERMTIWWWWRAWLCIVGWHGWGYMSHGFEGCGLLVTYRCQFCGLKKQVWEDGRW